MKQEYPEHEKLHAVRAQSQSIGEFLDWLFNECGYVLCCTTDHSDHPYVPCGSDATITRLLARYFDINEEKLENEKLALLQLTQQSHITP